jgi:hypothetical protein
MNFHKPSLFVGASVVGLVLLVASAMQATAPATAAVPPQLATLAHLGIQVGGIPTPGQMVQIDEGVPYTVPAGKVLVVTGLGAIFNTNADTSLFVNGIKKFSSVPPINGSSMCALPNCFTAGAGDVVEPRELSGLLLARAWGYVAAL